jgi:hypothetical protein
MKAGRSSHPTVLVTLLASLVVTLAATRARAAPEIELGAAAGLTRSWDGRREVSVLLSLSLQLERRVPLAPDRRISEPGEKRAKAEPAAEVREPEPDAWEPPPPRLTPALARATLRAALSAAGQPRARVRLTSLARRARSSAALPELRLRAQRTTDESLRLAPTAADPYRYTRAGGVSTTYEARATWRLDRLVFADEEVRIEELRRMRRRSELQLVDDVLEALVAWQRALWGEVDPAASPEERLAARLGRIQSEVTLDLLTAGGFSRLVRRTGQKRLARPRAMR